MSTQVTKQHEARVKVIQARRAGKKYVEPALVTGADTPAKQAEAQAKRILAKRGVTPVEAVAEDTEVSADFDAPVLAEGAVALEDMTKKQLKLECDAVGIVYPKKATNEALITLLMEK